MAATNRVGNVGTERYRSATNDVELKCTVTEIPAAEVRTLAASPVTIAPAPGAGKVILFQEATVSYDYGAAHVDGGNFNIKYTDGSGTVVSTTLKGDFIDDTADIIKSLKQLTTDITLTANAALVFDNDGSEVSGTGTSPLRITCIYYIVDDGLA